MLENHLVLSANSEKQQDRPERQSYPPISGSDSSASSLGGYSLQRSASACDICFRNRDVCRIVSGKLLKLLC